MAIPHWQLKIPVSAIVFDCDGTLSAIEGIDELAKKNGVYKEVKRLTAAAMGTIGIHPALYQKRLDLVRPKREQILALGKEYYHERVPDVCSVINLLHRLNKSIYIVSAGLTPAVSIFGKLLTIPEKNIYSVGIEFDREGHFSDYERTSPLINRDGKRIILSQLKIKHPNIIHIGDGLNDYVTHDIVTRFIGYGGIFYRENMEKNCEYYIRTPSLSPLISLVLTEHECEKLLPEEYFFYQKEMENNKITMKYQLKQGEQHDDTKSSF